MTLAAATWTDTAADTLGGALAALAAGGMIPGGVLAVGTVGSEPRFVGAGVVDPDDPESGTPDADTVYDLASVTKVMPVWALVGAAVEDGLLDLDGPIRDFLPRLPAGAPGGAATVRQLLSHTSGLRVATRMDRYRGADAPLHELICGEPLETEPGTHRYISRGYILLGLALAHVHGRALDGVAGRWFAGLGMSRTGYGPVGRAPWVAPSARRIPGAPALRGTVNDESAALLGGVAGHAGVFSTARDVARFADAVLGAYAGGAGGGPGEWLRVSMRPVAAVRAGEDRGLGWVLARGGRVAYQNGFTGTSVFLAPGAGRWAALLTNAGFAHHGAAAPALGPLRGLVQEMLAEG